MPAIEYSLNGYFSIGIALNHSNARFLLKPISGLPSLNISDSQSHNESHAGAFGGDIGFLLQPDKTTVLGLNYRGAIHYAMHGTSTFNGAHPITSNTYRFKYWTPARTVFSISHFVTKQLAFIGTIQYIQWDIFKEANIHNIATLFGILPKAKIHYHFHNAWLVTAGSNFRLSPKWVLRAAISYTQSPSNNRFQIDNGDSLTLGGSMGYTLFKNIVIDCSYAHAFIKNQNVHVITAQNAIEGINKSVVDSVALKLTVNI